MKELACTEQRFLHDVRNHEMHIIRDNELYRHIRFKDPSTSAYYFDILTWPGNLCIRGDCGTYVFCRTEDMFAFFRMDKGDFNYIEKRKLQINVGYWAEKVVAQCIDDGIEQFSKEKFKLAVTEYYKNNIVGHDFSKEQKKDIWRTIQSELFRSEDNEYLLAQRIYDFDHEGFQFIDFFENNLKEYSFRYVWCCFAIAYTIRKYDEFYLSVGNTNVPKL